MSSILIYFLNFNLFSSCIKLSPLVVSPSAVFSPLASATGVSPLVVVPFSATSSGVVP